MVSISQVLLVLIASWLVLITIASRYDLQRYNFFVSSGFFIWKTDWFTRKLSTWGKWRYWSYYGRFASLVIILLFFMVPVILILNLILYLLNETTTIFPENPFTILRVEIFLLILPAIFLVVSLYFITKGLLFSHYELELKLTGILTVLAIVTWFVKTPQLPANSKKKLQILAGGIMINFILFLLIVPTSFAASAMVDATYNDSSGAIVLTIVPNSPAHLGGLAPNDVITGLQFTDGVFIIGETTILSATEFHAQLRQIPAGIPFLLVTQRGSIYVVGNLPPAGESQLGSFIGVEVSDYREPRVKLFSPLLPLWTDVFFGWMITLSLMFGLYQILPLPKSDGWGVMEVVLSIWNIKINSMGKRVIGLVSLLLLVANILIG